MTHRLGFAKFNNMSEERVNIHATEKKVRVEVYSPTEWALGMNTPSMEIDAYPVIHEKGVTFAVSGSVEQDGVADGLDSSMVTAKTLAAIEAELNAEGEILPAERSGDNTWILSSTGGFLRPGATYKVLVWFVSERPGDISAAWVASAGSVPRPQSSIAEPRGHRYRI